MIETKPSPLNVTVLYGKDVEWLEFTPQPSIKQRRSEHSVSEVPILELLAQLPKSASYYESAADAVSKQEKTTTHEVMALLDLALTDLDQLPDTVQVLGTFSYTPRARSYYLLELVQLLLAKDTTRASIRILAIEDMAATIQVLQHTYLMLSAEQYETTLLGRLPAFLTPGSSQAALALGDVLQANGCTIEIDAPEESVLTAEEKTSFLTAVEQTLYGDYLPTSRISSALKHTKCGLAPLAYEQINAWIGQDPNRKQRIEQHLNELETAGRSEMPGQRTGFSGSYWVINEPDYRLFYQYFPRDVMAFFPHE